MAVRGASMTGTGARSTVAACTLAVGLAAALGFVPGYVATSLRADLGLSRAEVGLIVSLYFGSTGVMSILGGSVTDRIGARRVIVGDMVVVAACASLAAWWGDLVGLLLTSVIAGAGYAGVNAATNAAIAAVVDPARRTVALSVKTGGVPAMASVAALLGAPLAASTSWRVVWMVVAVLALCSGVLAFRVLPREAVAVARGVRRGRAPSGVWWFSLGAFMLVAGSQPLFSWLVPYLEEAVGTSASVAGSVASFSAAVGLGLLVVNARSVDRSVEGSKVTRLGSLCIATAVSVVLVMLGSEFGLVVAVLGGVGGVALQLAAIGTMHALVVERSGGAVAAATGVTMTGYYLGALVSPVAFGALVDATGSYSTGWLALVALLVGSTGAWFVGGRVTVGATPDAFTSRH